MTTQGTMGAWVRTPKGREWRIGSDWAQDDPQGWVVTRLANRTTRRHEWDWTDFTEMTLRTAAGDDIEVIVDENNRVTTLDGESAPDDVAEVAQSFRVEVGR